MTATRPRAIGGGMSLLEAAVQGPGGVLGIAVGWVGTRYVAPAVGMVLRPIAKTVIRGALVVNDEVEKIVHPPRRARQRAGKEDHGVTIAVAAKSARASTPRARRSRVRPASAGPKRAKHPKAHAHA